VKEDVLDVLLYLFENYMVEDPEVRPDQDVLNAELVSAGFGQGEIGKAFDWLEDLSVMCDDTQPEIDAALDGGSVTGFRHLSHAELTRFGTEGYGLLILLESSGILDAPTRELVIDRVMALDSNQVDLDHVRWVIMMVLCSRPGSDEDPHVAAWVEELVMEATATH